MTVTISALTMWAFLMRTENVSVSPLPEHFTPYENSGWRRQDRCPQGRCCGRERYAKGIKGGRRYLPSYGGAAASNGAVEILKVKYLINIVKTGLSSQAVLFFVYNNFIFLYVPNIQNSV